MSGDECSKSLIERHVTREILATKRHQDQNQRPTAEIHSARQPSHDTRTNYIQTDSRSGSHHSQNEARARQVDLEHQRLRPLLPTDQSKIPSQVGFSTRRLIQKRIRSNHSSTSMDVNDESHNPQPDSNVPRTSSSKSQPP